MFVMPSGPTWEKAVGFAKDFLSKAVDANDFQYDLWRCCGSFGLLGLPVPHEYGGQALDVLKTTLTMEAIGYGCRNNGLLAALNAHAWSCVLPIWKLGSVEQKQTLLPRLCSGEWVAAHGATEYEAGSDIFKLRTVAERRGDSYVLNGQKAYILNAPVADLIIIFANVDPNLSKEGITGFLVARETQGVTISKVVNKMGLHTAPMGEITLENCEVPVQNRLGTEGMGLIMFQTAMLWERTLILAPHVGTMRRVLEQCIHYAKKRQQFGQSIGKFQAVSHRIADMKVRLDAARLLLYQAAFALQRGSRDLIAASTAKLFISEAAVATYMDAIRVHGASGYTHELEFAKDLQDGIGTVIFSGTSDIQKQIIASCLGL